MSGLIVKRLLTVCCCLYCFSFGLTTTSELPSKCEVSPSACMYVCLSVSLSPYASLSVCFYECSASPMSLSPSDKSMIYRCVITSFRQMVLSPREIHTFLRQDNVAKCKVYWRTGTYFNVRSLIVPSM